ncbi:YjeF N-terminal domain-like protein [Auricularia subglabra TFB-10046 SS5]|nr:YjeF N-terminal domain-like protein [Auricularia subglabra TFB-10046 SS5]
MRYLDAKLAQEIDNELMGEHGAFSLDQLMELAGLACATALQKVFPLDMHQRVLVCCGPGNQGGDGLVAARHLGLFGYQVTIYLPKPGSKDIYKRLQQQCTNMDIPVISDISQLEGTLKSTDVVLDAIFGFSFKPPVRAPFDEALSLLSGEAVPPIVSVDIPSGWDVDGGKPKAALPVDGASGGKKAPALEPAVLISLTAPKQGVREFKGRHFLGGRFVPKYLEEKYQLALPKYPGSDQVVELPSADNPVKL